MFLSTLLASAIAMQTAPQVVQSSVTVERIVLTTNCGDIELLPHRMELANYAQIRN